MLTSYRWRIIACTLLVGFLGGAFLYAKSTEAQQQIPKRNRDNKTVLTIGLHGVGLFYSAKERYGRTNFVLDLAESDLFDIFCSEFDTDWLRPSQDSSTPALQRLGGLRPKPAKPTRRRNQLRPC